MASSSYSRQSRRTNYRSVKSYAPSTSSYNPYLKWNKHDSTAMKALKVAHNVRQLLNVEYKKHDVAEADQSANSTTPQVRLLNGIELGDDFDQRDGRSIRFKSIEMRLRAYLDAGDTGVENATVRVLLVLDTKPRGTLPVWADIVSSTGTTITSSRQMTSRNRFVIKKEFLIDLCASGTSIWSQKEYMKVDFHTIFGADGSGIADIEDNALYLVFTSSRAALADPPSLDYMVRTRYIDN